MGVKKVCIFWLAVCGVLPTAMAFASADKAVAVRVRAAETLGANRYAVIIGINDYKDDQIPNLKYAESDARAIYDLLTDPHVGGIERKNAVLLLGKDATTRNIRKALSDLRTVPRDVTVFIFFSGHGAKEEGDAFWVTHDSELGGLGYSAFPDREVRALTDRIPSSRLIMMLDCCYAAATVKEQKSVVDLTEAMKQFVGKGRVTITASGSGEEAIEAADLKRGVFAHYLVEGMRGQADGVGGPRDGVVTVPELTAYLDKTVAEAARQRRGIQRPAVFMEEVQDPGKFLVTIDPERIAQIQAEKHRQSEQVRTRLETLRNLFVEDAITVEQYQLGRRLIEEVTDRLDEFDRQRLEVYIELADGEIPAHRLRMLIDAIETPEQRAARLERERLAALEAAKRKTFEDHLSAAQQIITDSGLTGQPSGAIPQSKRQAAEQALAQIESALKLYPQDEKGQQLKAQLHPWILSWPFDSQEAKRRQEETARTLGVPREITIDCGNGVMMKLVLIPAGEFMMGSNDGHSDEKPVRRVRSSKPFYMGKYEVTQVQYQAVMGTNPSRFKDGGNLPVEQISWNDAMEFCKRLSERTGRTITLPSEAQWEYACRAGTNTAFHYGNSLSSTQANFDGNYPYGGASKGPWRQKTTSVGSFQPNAFGLYDMHGNVNEWCLDVSHDNYTDAPTDGSAWMTGGDQDRRVLRGGSWDVSASGCRSALRIRLTPGTRDYSCGFRVLSGFGN